MILDDKTISLLLKEPLNRPSVAEGLRLQNAHRVHITGEGYKGRIRQVKGFEDSKEFNVKTQLGAPATIGVTSIILDNLNRWQSTSGTVKKCDFYDDTKNEKFQDVLSQVWNNNSFDDFLKTFYKEAIYTDFNGFIVVTKPKIIEGQIEKEGILSNYEGGAVNPYMIYISIADVHDFRMTGDKVEYLIIRLSKDQKKFRVIDDARDIVVDDGKIQEDFYHEVGYTPARRISSINKYLLDSQIKTSPIDHIIPALDRYMSCDYDLRMQIIRHAYPKLAVVVRQCHSCRGQGFEIKEDGTRIKCTTCDGSMVEIPINRDGVIGIPQYLETGNTAYPGSPASYITTDTESLRLCMEDLEKQRKDILYAGTGDKALITETMDTATETMVNNRSLEDRISEISEMVERFEKWCKETIKRLHQDFSKTTEYEISVKYGKRISIKNETDILSEIQESKKSGMNMGYVQGLQIDLVYAKYKNNETELTRQIMLNDLEPFPGYTVDEIMRMAEYCDEKDLKLKINFESVIDKFEKDQPVYLYEKGDTYKEKINLIKEELYALLNQ